MIEVELKIPLKYSLERTAANLGELGFAPKSFVREQDTYFDTSIGQIRQNGEALRIRETSKMWGEQTETRITFKGHKLNTRSMTRQELETTIGDAETGMRILQALGYRPVRPTVIKIRREYEKESVTACLDQVEGLGDYLELETVIAEGEDREGALQLLEQILKQLGYTLAETTRTSYLTQLQNKA